MAEPGFTDAVRQELAGLPLGTDAEVRAELSGLTRVAGVLARRGGVEGHELRLETTSGAVARRGFQLLGRAYDVRPELTVWQPGGVRRRTTYGVGVRSGAERIAADLGVIDTVGRPTPGLPTDLGRQRAVACLRGVVLGAGSLSAPDRSPHLELACRTTSVAAAVAALVGEVTGTPGTVVDGRRPRVVVKSGERIGDLLRGLGATQAFLAIDERRLRRQLRSEANRLANADAANLRRTIEAAAVQVGHVETVVAARGWDALDDDLRQLALVRLANPEASLAELGELLTPAVGRSTVHRRMRQLERLAAELPPGASPPPPRPTDG